MQPAQNGASAVVRIEDPANGSEGYTFEIRWGGPPEVPRGGPPMVAAPPERDRGAIASAFGDAGTGRAVQACEAAAEQRMAQDGFRRRLRIGQG
jgi:hypothetical protein